MVCSLLLFSLSCGKNSAEIAKKLGFIYERDQDIYVSKVNAWQRKAGYSSLIDLASAPVSMVIHCEPIKFDYNGNLKPLKNA